MARLGGRPPRPGEPRGGGGATKVAGTRVVVWWRARVVAPVRRAWLAVVAARARTRKRGTESTGIVDLHKDVQTCGYHDVQVMWDMLGLENGASGAPAERRKPSPFWPPSFWHVLSSHHTAAR